jgi:hypothetical protein
MSGVILRKASLVRALMADQRIVLAGLLTMRKEQFSRGVKIVQGPRTSALISLCLIF